MIGVADYQFVAMSANRIHIRSGRKARAKKMPLAAASVDFFKSSGLANFPCCNEGNFLQQKIGRRHFTYKMRLLK
jgi:hypothetical protein